ncbi:MAG: hypothetical protein B7Y39_15425 [Bdellovibrio sp. 28-41-41]|nr:MAG: hypothetical protein B7Y39_15425 [Bdellovibrio sp. 28-41-41]
MLKPHIYSAPSNIAIIKYMGKTSTQQNLPTNASISYTLNHLRSFITLEPISGDQDQWQPLSGDGLLPIELSEKGRAKFLNHLARIKEIWGVSQSFLVKSANNFPSDCGIASSSSSFAALTLAAVSELEKIKPGGDTSYVTMSKISRLGSGSSCRSFFEPWAVWEADGAEPWPGHFIDLNHSVMLLDSGKKDVSSSDAHVRVTTSPLFPKRLANVKTRLEKIEIANAINDWNQFCDLAIEEFEEMHQLFETSVPSFSYRNENTMAVLKRLIDINNGLSSKMLVTMDAGNNIHLMTLPENRHELERLSIVFPKAQFVNSWSFTGARRV